MISGAVILRSLRGFSAMKILPVFVAPPPPVNAITFWTAGSFLITSTIFWTESFMAGEEEARGACPPPPRLPGACWGEKPLGNMMRGAEVGGRGRKKKG